VVLPLDNIGHRESLGNFNPWERHISIDKSFIGTTKVFIGIHIKSG
jgi:hypothetical protein